MAATEPLPFAKPYAPPGADPLLTMDEVATWLRVTTEALRQWHRAGTGPRRTYLSGRAFRYKLSDVQAYLAHPKDKAA